MTAEIFHDSRVTLWCGDCTEVVARLPENSIDSIVTDPPYHLHSITKRFAKTGRTKSTCSKSGPHQRTTTGFMGKHWDGGDIAFKPETWATMLRVLKPGGYLVAFSSCRTFGRMSVAIEDAGFITHPFVAWVFGQGFPKAHNAAKAIDRELGIPGKISPAGDPVRRIRPGADQHRDGSWEKLEDREYQPGSYVPGSEEAEAWLGWAYGAQALKPAIEPIYVGQKPFSEKNGAANILRWRTGALNIDACKVPGEKPDTTRGASAKASSMVGTLGAQGRIRDDGLGRWPANVVHDGSAEVVEAFPNAPGQQGQASSNPDSSRTRTIYGQFGRADSPMMPRGDSGSAARFFYTAKADADDRLGSKHPTVKPLDLMQWLARLVTPPGGTILDPFAGTGTTGEAAIREGFRAVLIECEAEYQENIRHRMMLALAGPEERRRAAIKASGRTEPPGPLFAELAL